MSATTSHTINPALPRWVWPLGLLGLVAIATVGFDQSHLLTAAFGATGERLNMFVHEFFHDGRHLLGFPCH